MLIWNSESTSTIKDAAMSKRLTLALLMTLTALFIAPATAHGDVITYEYPPLPPETEFYEQNSAACEEVSLGLTVESEEGFVSVLEEPGTGKELAQIPNEDYLFINHTYELEGELWGNALVKDWQSQDGESFYGWVPISQLIPLYTTASFAEEFGSEFYSEGRDLANLDIDFFPIVWTWPGSGVTAPIFSHYEDVDLQDKFQTFYLDDQGREWGFLDTSRLVDIYRFDGWVCVSDPLNDQIEAFNWHTQAPIELPIAHYSGPAPQPESNYIYHFIVAGFVVLLAVVMGVLIRVVIKKKKASSPKT